MGFAQAIILGIVQGLTEFLPISSSGHLVIFQSIMRLSGENLVFDVAVHLGTLLTVITFYFGVVKRVFVDLVGFRRHRKITAGVRLFALVFVGSIPTALIGFALKDYFELMFSSRQTVGFFLCLTGIILFLTRSKKAKMSLSQAKDLNFVYQITFRQALVIGTAQGLAIAPGISRSGTTISTAILLGIEPAAAALFSFILAVPAILGAVLLQFGDLSVWGSSWEILGVGVVTAYLSGLLGLWGVLYFVQRSRLEYFSYYLWCAGLAAFFI